MISFQVEEVSPDRASQFLSMNGVNRNLRKSHVTFLAGAMLRGEWELNGEAIKFTKDGRLIDGQHRLNAIVQAGVPIVLPVVRGVDDSAFKTLDTGAARNHADALSIAGESLPTQLAAALRIVTCHDLGKLQDHFSGSAGSPSNKQLHATLQQHPAVRDWVRKAYSDKIATGFRPPTLAAICYLSSCRSNGHRAYEFIEAVGTGVGLDAGNPALLLRERVWAEIAKKHVMRRKEYAAILIKAINAYRSGKSIKLLRWLSAGDRQEPFPQIDP